MVEKKVVTQKVFYHPLCFLQIRGQMLVSFRLTIYNALYRFKTDLCWSLVLGETCAIEHGNMVKLVINVSP